MRTVGWILLIVVLSGASGAGVWVFLNDRYEYRSGIEDRLRAMDRRMDSLRSDVGSLVSQGIHRDHGVRYLEQELNRLKASLKR